MRKILAIVLLVLIVFGLVACGGQDDNSEASETVKPYTVNLEIEFEENIFFNTYDVLVFFDGKKIGKVEHGKFAMFNTSVVEGEYTIRFEKDGDSVVSGETSIDVQGDSTFKCKISSKKKKIEVSEVELLSGVENENVVIGDEVSKELDVAIEELEKVGFGNIKYKSEGKDSIFDITNWIVTVQSPEAGESVSKDTDIVLTCVKVDTYLTNLVTGEFLPEAIKQINLLGYSKIVYCDNDTNEDITSTILAMSDEEKGNWYAVSANDISTDEKKIRLYVVGNKISTNDKNENGILEEETESEEVNALKALKGKSMKRALKIINKYGYTASFKHEITKEKFSEESFEYYTDDDLKEIVVTKVKNIDEAQKTLLLIFNSKAQIAEQKQQKKIEKELTAKLGPSEAWGAMALYGGEVYPYGFKLHIATNTLAERAVDEDTWFLKAGCTIKNMYGAH